MLYCTIFGLNAGMDRRLRHSSVMSHRWRFCQEIL